MGVTLNKDPLVLGAIILRSVWFFDGAEKRYRLIVLSSPVAQYINNLTYLQQCRKQIKQQYVHVCVFPDAESKYDGPQRWSPPFLALGISFMENNFSPEGWTPGLGEGDGYGFEMIQVH